MDMKLTPHTWLCDGTYLADLRCWKNGYLCQEPRISVRVIAYTLDDPQRNPDKHTFRLITTLKEPALYPAETLIGLYHQRWEIELTIDEIDTHQRLPWTPFRSQKPVGVIQEFYALLLAYFIVRSVIHQTAVVCDATPQRFSFINALRLIQQSMPIAQLLWGTHRHRLLDMFHQWQLYFQLPPRDNRLNPRVVKRKRDKFRRKRPEDRSVQLLPFAQVVRLVRT